jgi:repressor LexA
MNEQPLTKRQREILNYIQDFIKDFGYSPSYREIGEHFSLRSTATVAEHVETLKEKGYLDGADRSARSLTLTEDPLTEVIGVPLLGAIAAGSPIEAIRTNETIDIPHDMAGKNTFALRVRGNSMIDDAILDGDYVVIEATSHVRDGEIVVALLDDGTVTLKRIYREANRIRLQPANKTMQPIYVQQVTVQGRVKGVIRRMTFL